uniref:Putative secreted protein n=1 Tax=Anopheles triannulatus TaxID=58253 RepID=A0A2M4B291_9DIPT
MCWPSPAYSCTIVALARQTLAASRALDPTLGASFHRSPEGSLPVLPSCSRCRRASLHPPMEFSGKERDRRNRFPTAESQSSTCRFYWRIYPP